MTGALAPMETGMIVGAVVLILTQALVVVVAIVWHLKSSVRRGTPEPR